MLPLTPCFLSRCSPLRSSPAAINSLLPGVLCFSQNIHLPRPLQFNPREFGGGGRGPSVVPAAVVMEKPSPPPPPFNKSKEIKSPPPLMPSSASLQRKKLGSHFLASDERRFAAVASGAPNAVGTTPLDIRGAPIPERDLPRTGGWVAAFFIFGNETAERMAYYGLSVNMVVFLFKVMHLPFAASAGAVNTFLGISQASSVLGGFLADAYLGRYWTIAIFATLYLLGLVALTLAATLPSLVPSQQGCDTLAMLLGGCQRAEPWQMAYLYAALYVTAFGAAGIRPCVSSFGADQFDDRDAQYKRRLDRFFYFTPSLPPSPSSLTSPVAAPPLPLSRGCGISPAL